MDAELLTFTNNHRKRLVNGAREIAAVGDKLAAVLSDIDRRQDYDAAAKARYRQAARQAAREQLAAIRREHAETAKESAAMLRRIRRADSWTPGTEAAIASHAAHLMPLLQARAREGSIEQAVRSTLDELQADGNAQGLLALRRIAPSVAKAGGRPLSEPLMRDLDTLASIHYPAAAAIGRAVAYEGELLGPSGAKNLEVAAGQLDAELVGPVMHAAEDVRAFVLPNYGTKDPLFRHGASRADNGAVQLPERTPAAEAAEKGQADQVAEYRELVFGNRRQGEPS